jgi:hypothetical protein
MLAPEEELAVAEQFGVARAQVRRDHLISHLLATLSAHLADQVIFFGGTALSRSLLPNGRLSEDIDLIAVGRRRDVAESIELHLVQENRREFPRLNWQPALSSVREIEPAVLTTADGVSVRIQLLGQTGYPPWPVQPRPLVQRYSDAQSATLVVPARSAFAAWKTVAWHDRAAPRDLFDLWSLAGIGAIDSEAAELFAKHGPTNKPPSQSFFVNSPDEAVWRRDLSSQTRLQVSAADALAVVRQAWRLATS